MLGTLESTSVSPDDDGALVAILAIGGGSFLLIFVIPILFGVFKAAHNEGMSDDPP